MLFHIARTPDSSSTGVRPDLALSNAAVMYRPSPAALASAPITSSIDIVPYVAPPNPVVVQWNGVPGVVDGCPWAVVGAGVHGAEGGAGTVVTYVGIERDPIVVPWLAKGVYEEVVSADGVVTHVVEALVVVDADDVVVLTGAVVGCDWTVVVLV